MINSVTFFFQNKKAFRLIVQFYFPVLLKCLNANLKDSREFLWNNHDLLKSIDFASRCDLATIYKTYAVASYWTMKSLASMKASLYCFFTVVTATLYGSQT